MALQIRRTSSVKVRLITTLVMAFAIVAQPFYGMVSSQVAAALGGEITVTPNNLTVEGANPSVTEVSLVNATGYQDLKVSFDYNAEYLDNNDELLYGWRTAGGTNGQLGFVEGDNESAISEPADETGSVTDLIVPDDANNKSFELYFTNTGKTATTNGTSDAVALTNITVSGVVVSSAPVIGETAPANNETITSDDYTIKAVVTDLDGDVESVHWDLVPVTAGGTPSTSTGGNPDLEQDGDTWKQTYTTENIKDGEYKLTFTASDSTGKTDTKTVDLIVGDAVIATGSVENINSGEFFPTIQAGLNDTDTSAGDTLELSSDITTSQQITIDQAVTINGNGHTINANFDKTDNSNNAVIGIIGTTDVTISDLTIDGNHKNIHGINVYESTAVYIDGVSINNSNAGLVVNSSEVTVNNLSTAGNSWYAVNVDQKTTQSAMLAVEGTSSHTEEGKAHIYVDDSTREVVIQDVNEQYSVTIYGNTKVYVLTYMLPNTSGPKINVITPADNSTVAGEITVNVKATDPDGDAVRNVSLKFLGDNDFESSSYNLEQIDDSNIWQVTLNTNDFESNFGRYTMKFGAYDDRGKNRGDKSTKINVDNANPIITVEAPLNGEAGSGDVLVKVKIDERGAAGLNRVYVKFQENGSDKESGQYTLYREGDTDFYSRTINTNEFESGSDTYTLKFVANDTVGNSRSHKSVNNFLIDNASPSIQFLSHDEGAVIGGEETVRVKITDDSPLNYVTFKLVGSEFGESHGYAMQKVDGTVNEYEVTFDTRDTVPAGETANYNFKVSTEDTQSHNRSSKLAVTIDNEASAAPVISTPSEAQEFPGTPGVIRAEWSAPDDTSGIDRYQIRYEYTRDGSVVVDTRYTDNPYRDQQLSGSVLSAFTIDVRAQDNVGNWSEWSDAVTYYYGIIAPSNEGDDEDDDSTSNGGGTDSSNTGQGNDSQQSTSQAGAITALTQPIFANAANNGLVFNGSDVLGAQDDDDENTEDDDAAVLGTQDNGTPLANTGAIETGNDIFKIFGLAWFWWLAIASVAVAGWLWLAAAIRRYRGTEI